MNTGKSLIAHSKNKHGNKHHPSEERIQEYSQNIYSKHIMRHSKQDYTCMALTWKN
jgi:hypothetical protein